ncbi:hypothetical protein DdX_09363 [Ditylenchus destructor]|uniref:Uncharacterized protein n=1 Tax=Ditylenchus destructor TaxID=166010 RepID=A0AAD4R6G6_9BILA|nr:hypothetical protein DdX_09363 [Ditylenchus destructor]
MRNAAHRAPAPLVIDVVSNLDAEPVSTTAKFEEYEEKRQEALQMSPMQLRKMSEKEREEYVFQYLTPDEIWVLKDAIKKIPPVSKIELPPKTQDSDGLHNIASGFTEHDQKRREFLSLSDEQLLQLPVSQLEFYYQYLSPDEIMEQSERLKCLKGQF